MKQSFTHYRKGYLLVRLQGFSPERFLNLCMANQIEIWGLEDREGQYQFFMTVEGYRRVRPLVQKAHVRLSILGKAGLPFFLYQNRKRKLYGIGITSFFLILWMMSLFIWDITIEGNNRFTDDTLLHFLNVQEIRYGVRKSGIDCDSLEEAIRTTYPEIIWVSARVSGTRLRIKVKENEVISVIPVKETRPRNLVAVKDGIITGMVVRRGKPMVGVGDTVSKGQVLISGEIPIRNDAGEVVNVQYVRADADIQAQTICSYTETMPVLTTVRFDTGRVRHGIQIRVFQHSLLLLIPPSGSKSWEYIRENQQVVVLNDFYLPLWFDRIVGKEYDIYERFLTKEEKESIKTEINNQKIQKLEEKGVQIIQNNVKILNKSSTWQVQGEFLVEEPIGTEQNIRMIEETDQPDEHNRDDY